MLPFDLGHDMFCSRWSSGSGRGSRWGGSPVMEEILITATYDFEEKKRLPSIWQGLKTSLANTFYKQKIERHAKRQNVSTKFWSLLTFLLV